MNILSIAAFLAGLIGFSMLTQATMGVGLVCIGCLSAILARIIQQERHHKEMKDELAKLHGNEKAES